MLSFVFGGLFSFVLFCSGCGSVRDIALQDGRDGGGRRRELRAGGDRLHGLCDVDELSVRLHHGLAAVHDVGREAVDGDSHLYVLAAAGDVEAEAQKSVVESGAAGHDDLLIVAGYTGDQLTLVLLGS